jgi:hypothetical protein
LFFRRPCQDLRFVDGLSKSGARSTPSASAGASFFSFPGRDLVPVSFGLVPGSAFAFAFAFERTDQRAPLAVCSAPDPPSASAGASFYPISLDVVGSSRSRRRVFRSGSRLRLRFRSSARSSRCVLGARSTKCQRRCFFLPHLPRRRRFVAISSAGLSIWFSPSASLSLSRSARSSRCVFGARSTKCQRRCFFLPHLPRRRRFVAIWFPFLPSPSLAVGHRQIKRRPSTTPRQPPPPSPHLPGPCSVAVAIRSQLSQLAIKPARN